jgi:transposase-like protein
MSAPGRRLVRADPGGLVQRNGYRERAWDTRGGRIELEIPKAAPR